MALGKLDIIIAGDTAQLRKDMSTAVGIMQSSTKQMESFAKNAAGLIGGYFTADLFKKQINQTLEFAESLNKLRQKTGMSADSLYSLNAAAELADVNYEDMSKSLTKFTKAIGETSSGTGESRKSFDRLGISIKNQDGTLKNSFDLLGEVADQFEKMPDGASKATIAMGLFGKAGTSMIPLLNEGKDSLRKYLGVMDNETGIAAERFNDSLKMISLSTKSGLISVMKEAIPTLNDLSETFESIASKGGLLARNAKDIGYAINSSYTFIKDHRDGIFSLGEAYLVYKASVWATTTAQNTFNAMQEYSAKVTAQNVALTTASAEAERLGLIAIQNRIAADTMRNEGAIGNVLATKANIAMLEKEALASELAAKSATAHSYELQSLASKTGVVSIAMTGLSTAFKTFAPTAILFGITEIFLNWDKITGNIKTNLVSASDQLEKMTINQLTAQLDAYKNKITEINEEIQKLSPKSKGFSYFGTLSEEDKTKAKAQIDTLKQQKEQIEKTVEEINSLKNNPKKEKPSTKKDKGSDNGLPNENDLKKYNATLAAQIQGLEKQFGIRTQIENLNIEAALRNDAISKPEAEYLKEKNDILSQIAKNQETINLLGSKKYDLNNENDKVADQQKVNDLLKENELEEKKLIAAEERKQATIKAGNLDLKNQIYALDLTETDKQYQSLADSVANLIKEGRDLSLVGQFATKQADRIEIQKRLDSTQEMLNLQEGYIALLDDEDTKKIALTNLDSDRRIAEFKYLEELTPKKAAYYQQEIENEEKLRQKTLEHLTTYGQVIDGVASDMTSSFGSFIDYSSDRFLKFGKLLESVANDIYNEFMKIAVIKPIVSSLTTSAFSLFSTPSTASASTASSYILGSGGSLTNSYFQAYNGGMIPFASGGYTGDGGKYEPKGVVHGGEYVMPAWMVQKNKPLVSALETTRIRGYSDGGSVGGNVSGGNMRVEIKNESSQLLEVTSATKTYDSEGAVLSIVINGIQKNKMGLRDMLGAK